MSLGKRLIDVARANLNDFARGFTSGDELEVEPDEDDEGTVGARAGRFAGRTAKAVRDRAEEAWERAFEAAQARAQASGGAGPRRLDAKISRMRWYATLEVSPGTAPEDVRRSYRRLMSQYHPDRFANDPEKYRAATEITRKLTEAYNGLKELSEA